MKETAVFPGDPMSRFTKEQVALFPDEVKSALVYRPQAMPRAKADWAIVLGGPAELMPSRAAAAAALYRAGLAATLVVSGGVVRPSPFGALPEAEILSRYLQEAGVPARQILPEVRSTTTVENMLFCRALLEVELKEKAGPIAIVSSNFHIHRACRLAAACFGGHETFGVAGEYPNDRPEAYLQDAGLCQCIDTECRCLWNYVQKGYIPDFPVL